MHLRCGSHTLDLTIPAVMGILNVTPDSFSDGGLWLEPTAAVDHALAMVEAGAGIIDVGGESTRPGAPAVSEAEELERVLPVIRLLTQKVGVPISVDTSRAKVIEAACDAGAAFVNDVRALTEPGALRAVAATKAAVCLMHMQGQPSSMQLAPAYGHVTEDVFEFLRTRAIACREAGIEAERLVVDPGIGFGKRLEHNLQLFANLRVLAELGFPVLVGASRKSLIGAITGRQVADRLAGSIAFATAATLEGASIIRAHDVGPTVDAVKIAAALRASNPRTQVGERS